MAVLLHALANDLAVGDIQGGKQRCRAIALVVVSHGLAPSLLDRQSRLRAVQRLNLALLVTG